MSIFDKIKESKMIKEKQKEEYEKNNVVAFMCNHLRDDKTKIQHASLDSRGIWRFTCQECNKKLNYENVVLVSLIDVIKLHSDECKDLSSIKENGEDWQLTSEMEDNIIDTNISRNKCLRSDITGVKINH